VDFTKVKPRLLPSPFTRKTGAFTLKFSLSIGNKLEIKQIGNCVGLYVPNEHISTPIPTYVKADIVPICRRVVVTQSSFAGFTMVAVYKNGKTAAFTPTQFPTQSFTVTGQVAGLFFIGQGETLIQKICCYPE